MERAIPRKLIDAAQLPSTARATLTGTDEYTLLHVKVTYPEVRGEVCAIEEHNVLPAGRRIRVKGNYRKAMLLPQQQEIPFTSTDGYAELELPQITGYQMFCLQK